MATAARTVEERSRLSPMLKQLVIALENFEPLRQDMSQWLACGPLREDDLWYHDRIHASNICCDERYPVLSHLARLSLSPDYQSPHRLERLLALLDEFLESVGKFVEASKTIWREQRGSSNGLRWWTYLLGAANMIIATRDCLVEHAGVSPEGNARYGGDRDAAQDITSKEEDGKLAASIEVTRYLARASQYEWPRYVEDMLEYSCLREDEEVHALSRKTTPMSLKGAAPLLLEKADGLFSRIHTSALPMYEDLDNPYSGMSFHWNCLNAVWLSPMTAGFPEGRTLSFYQQMFDAVFMSDVTGTVGDCKCVSEFYDISPMHLARAMHALGIDLGILFEDDLSMIVWPMGRSNADNRQIQVFCRRQYKWNYSAVARVKPPGRMEMKMAAELPLRQPCVPCDIDDLSQSVDGLQLQQNVPALGDGKNLNKPFPLLRLPAELRIKIYEAYLDDGDLPRLDARSRFSSCFRSIDVPELGQTCRQVRDEVIPIFVKTAVWDVEVVDKGRVCAIRHRHAEILNSGYRCMALPAAAHVSSVNFHSRRGKCVKLVLRQAEPGFAITNGSRVILAKYEQQLHELVAVLVADRKMKGLSFVDVAVIADFISIYL